MIVSRPLAIGGGIAAFALIVAWMVPPTTPKGGTTIAPSHAIRAAPEPMAAAAPADPSFSPAPPAAPPTPIDPAADGGSPPSSFPSPPPARFDRDIRSSVPPTGLDQDAGRFAPADPQEEFDRGYRWAERRQLEDPRECQRWAETPREDGCLAFLQDAREQNDDQEED
jgi:hypothetical protein